MVDRSIVYPGALPQDTDILSTNKYMLLGSSYLNRAALGTSTVVSGLACTPTSPTPDLFVHVDVGSIYQLDPTDATAYGSLGTDNANIMKQGILSTAVTLAITPPATVGFSQVYLVQAILNVADTGSLVLSYFNAANPASPYSGPANSGTSQFTTRTNSCAIALKAGVAAATGSQVTPSPDAGYVGLYAVTVANGATQITSGNIVRLTTAPFFPTLPGVPVGVRDGSWVWGTDTGTANHFIITVSPIPAAYVAGQAIRFKALFAVSGATDINVNGLGVVLVKKAGGAALATGDVLSGQVVELVYDGVNFQMVNYNGVTGSVTNNFATVGLPYVVDTGAANALIGTFSPAVVSYTAGLAITIKLANNITGAFTINANGLGVKNCLLGDLSVPQPNVMVAGEVLLLIYDGTQFQVYGITGNLYRKPVANTTIFVNPAMTGASDSNDGISNTANHALATIQGGVNKAFSYAPSQFTLTVVVEPGTYNETVVTPSYAGPNLIIDGLVTANVIVNSGAGSCITVQGPNTLLVKNLTVQNNGVSSNFTGFGASLGGQLTTQNTASGICGPVFYASSGGNTTPIGAHSFNGPCYSLYLAINGGTVGLRDGVTFTIGAPFSVGAASAVANANGTILAGAPIFIGAGSLSGQKYSAALNGVIFTSPSGLVFPGNIAGTTAGGGQYL